MAHPGRLTGRLPREQNAAVTNDGDIRRSVLAQTGVGNLAAEVGGHNLETVANAENRNPQLEDAGIERGRARLVHTRRATAQNHGGRIALGNLGRGHRVRNDLRVHVRFAHPAGNQLRILCTEVDNEDGTCAAHAGTSTAAISEFTLAGTVRSKKNDSNGITPPSAMRRKRVNVHPMSRHSRKSQAR